MDWTLCLVSLSVSIFLRRIYSLAKSVSSPVLQLCTGSVVVLQPWNCLHLLVPAETLGRVRIIPDLMPGSSPHKKKIDIKWTILPSDMHKSLNFCQSGRIANASITVSALMLYFWEQDPKCHVAISVPFPNFLHMRFLILIFFSPSDSW